MMSFFKKEHTKEQREDKEKKKLEKKRNLNSSKLNDTLNDTAHNTSLLIDGHNSSTLNTMSKQDNYDMINPNLNSGSTLSLSPKLSSSSKSSIDSSSTALMHQPHTAGIPPILPKPKKGKS